MKDTYDPFDGLIPTIKIDPDNNDPLSPVEEEEDDKEMTIFEIANPKYTESKRTQGFILLFILNMATNFDHGALPSASANIKKSLKLTDQ